MLDYQINESISRAYVESVCGRKNVHNFRNGGFICEDKQITRELVDKRNRRRRARGDKEVSYERELKRERRRQSKPNYAAEAGKGFVRASNVGARELAHMVPGAYALFGGDSETAKKMGKGIDDWFNPIIYKDYGSEFGDEVSALSERGGKLFATAIPAAGAAKVLKVAGGAKSIGDAMKYLNTGIDKGLLWKVPVGVAASRAVESGVENGSENLKKAGYEAAGDVLGEYGGFAPWMLSPLGSMTRYGANPVINYGQKRFGNKDSEPYVNAFQKYALGTYEGPNTENKNDNNSNVNGNKNDEDDGFLNCPRCEFSCNDEEMMKQHLRSKHGLVWNKPPKN